MEIRIEHLNPIKLVGKKLIQSRANERTAELWKSFMPHKHNIQNTINSDLFSLSIYDDKYFNEFNPDKEFEKWAAVEVTQFPEPTSEFEQLELEGGLYLVYLHKGDFKQYLQNWLYVFQVWLPASKYQLDNRPHFEILGEKYKNNDPESEEEVWIPICLKAL